MKIFTRLTTALVLVFLLSPLVMAQSGFKTLDYLYSISGKNILSGQHNDQKAFHGESTGAAYWTDEVFEVTGKYPALWGGDLLFHGNSDMRWEMTYEAEKQWKKGALVNIMWHAVPPNQTEPCNWDGGVLSSLSTSEWTDLLTEGGTLNTVWKSRIDDIAAPHLQYLEDKGVEVLWRPFHEQNQTLFWWNSGTAENTKALWRLTHDYMSNVLGLSNLIWSWDVQDIHSSYAQYNPGEDYFDLAAIDIYSDGFTNLKYYNALVEQANGKPVAFGECFKLPSSSVMNTQSLMSFFMIWAYGLYEDHTGSPTNTVQDIIDAYNNPRVITLDEMPGWNSFCAYDEVPSIPGVIEVENFGICGEGTSYEDSDTINVPGYYRDDCGVDIDTIVSGGYYISDIVSGEWTEYPVRVETKGSYVLELGVASDMDGKSFHIELNGSDITAVIDVPNTGGLLAWDTLSISLDVIDTGAKDLRLVMDTDGFSIDFMEFILVNEAPLGSIYSPEDGASFEKASDIAISVEASDPDGEILMVEFFNGTEKLGETSSEPYEFVWEDVAVGLYSLAALITDDEGLSVITDTVVVLVQEEQGPFLGYPHPIPGKIETEDYDFGGEGVSYHELSEGNKFLTTYHGDDPVDLEVSEDEGGGFQVGDYQDGEWLNYTVDVAARALYDVEIRYATNMDESAISLSVDGRDGSGTVPTPGTGGWQVFTTTVAKGISMTSGEHILTMHCVKGYQNVNWLNITESTVGVEPITVPGTIELSQNYPNPFSLFTRIHYQLPENSKVKLGVYNLLGMKVRGLVDQQQNAGSYQVDFSAEGLAPGVYIYRLDVGTKVYQNRMMLME